MTRIYTAIAAAAHRALDAITEDGRHPDNVALVVAALLLCAAAIVGWLD